VKTWSEPSARFVLVKKIQKGYLMNVKKYENIEIMKTPHGVDARNLYNTKDAMITIITLQPNEQLKRHITPVDVAFYVLEGRGIVEIGEEKQEVAAGTLVESPKDIVHCWYNQGAEPVRFMVIKAPKPTEKTIFVD